MSSIELPPIDEDVQQPPPELDGQPGDKLYEVEMAHKSIRLNIPIHLGKSVLDRAKLRMLEWVYDYLNVYLLPGSYQAIQMDTDSFYCAYNMEVDYAKLGDPKTQDDLDYHPFTTKIRPHLMEQWRALIWSQTDCCYDEWVPDYTRHFEPRRCCVDHNKHDQKTPFLFKLEAWGNKMTALSSKTYSLVEDGVGTKFATKGIQKRAIKQSRPEGADEHSHVYDRMTSAIEERNCGELVKNVSLRNDQKPTAGVTESRGMSTVSQMKAPFNIIYTKRVVQANGIDTEPLDITLRPPIRRRDPKGYNPQRDQLADDPEQLPPILREGEVMEIDLEDDRDRVLGEDYAHLREREPAGDDLMRD
jgi:hypothetical protein